MKLNRSENGKHFPNGQSFFQKRCSNDYLAAKEQVNRDFLTRYLLSIVIGMVAGFFGADADASGLSAHLPGDCWL